MNHNIVIVTGAAGFVGSHLVDRLLAAGHRVFGIDNFVRGTKDNLRCAETNPNFAFFEADISNAAACSAAFRKAGQAGPIQIVWHMAANSDISAGVADPNIDLRDTFLTTFHTLATMRELGVPEMAFASSSAVYGDHPAILTEDTGPLLPISNYGAMKLASEASLSAAVEGFLERAWIFRFPNVVGARATHGVIFDFLHKLRQNSKELEVLGDGSQQKPYLHVSELVDAMIYIQGRASDRLNCFNISGEEEGATVRFIAEEVVNVAAPGAKIRYGIGNKGWIGDVPRFRYSTAKLASLGWIPKLTSEQAVRKAVTEIHEEIFASCSS